MKTDISVFCTPDYFQHYAPLFAYCMHKTYPQYRTCVAVMGELDDICKRAFEHLLPATLRVIGDKEYKSTDSGIMVTQGVLGDIPQKASTANLARFLLPPETPKKKYGVLNEYTINAVFCTDIDMLYFNVGIDVVDWHRQKADQYAVPYFAHHGPWKLPNRFPGNSWVNSYERLAGGAVWLSAEWFEITKEIRDKYIGALMQGKVGVYREEDEVILCRICKEAGLWINQGKDYTAKLRGLHLGDFKSPEMNHRWQSVEKMKAKLTDENVLKFMEMEETDKTWQAIKAICCEDEKIKNVFDNVNTHLRMRRGN